VFVQVVGAFPVGPSSHDVSEIVVSEAGADDTSGQRRQHAADDAGYHLNIDDRSFQHITISLPGNV